VTEPLLLAATQVSTFLGERLLTRASGFFFARNERLFVVTSAHVVLDPAIEHLPDRIEIELHTDEVNLTRSTGFSLPLYQDGRSVWRQGRDSGGEIDVAVIEIQRDKLPASVVMQAFTLHHLPVVRQAIIASSFGLRFQGQGCFLTDARTHRGTSGAPVVMRASSNEVIETGLPWKLLGVHSARLDMKTRDRRQDESLGLNSAWYADILLKLTEPEPEPEPETQVPGDVVPAPAAADGVVTDSASSAAVD
jgi:hypothetical protein